MANTEINWLKSFRIAVIGNYVPAPLAAYLLKCLGAQVIKIERGNGDFLRMAGNQLFVDGEKMAGMFAALNKGFKGLHLEYQTTEGAKVLMELLKHVDVLLDGSKPGMLEKYIGLRPDLLSKDLIYIPISAYGQIGPMAQLGGHDNNVLGLAGNLSYTNTKADGSPAVFSAPIVDFLAGQSAAFAALAALIARQQGLLNFNQIDASMLHAGFFLNFLEIADQNFGNGKQPKPDAHWINGGLPNYCSYRCNDNMDVFFGAMEFHLFKRFLTYLGKESLLELTTQPEKLKNALSHVFLEKKQADWLRIGQELDVCVSAINDLNAALAEPQIQALGFAQKEGENGLKGSFPLGFGPESLQPSIKSGAPRLGEHSQEILEKFTTLSPAQIAQLIETKILGVADKPR